MTVPYASVPLAFVERAWNEDEPVFLDLETMGLYGDVVLAQFLQPSWDQALLVEYPDYTKLQQLTKQMHIVAFPIAYECGTLEIQPKKIDCLYIASKSVYPLLDKHGLADIVPQYYFGVNKKAMQKSFLKKRQGFSEEQLHYGALDVYALQEIYEDPKVEHFMANNLSYKVDMKNQWHALEWQHNGMPVIDSKWREAYNKTELERKEYQTKLNNILGTDLNVKSFKQKQVAFPELPSDPKTGKVPTGEPAFKKMYLETGKEVYKLVMDTTKRRTELQDLHKYEESYIADEHPVRIRTFFNVAGAITGRYTSKGGDRVGYTNIQNIGRHFKHIFGYEDDVERRIITADYSTAELIAGCEIMAIDSMRDLIMEGIDLHKAMASNLTRKPVSEITKDERQGAKAVNFGYLFGLGVEKFQGYAYDTYGVKLTMDECEEYKAVYYQAHPEIKAYHKAMGIKVKQSGFLVETAMGRVVHPDRYADALNIPVQGTIGECMKMAQNFLFEDYPSLMKEGYMINMVHDSGVLDFPTEYAEDAGEALSKSMKLGWKEISKSKLFTYHDLPMEVETDIAMCFK